MFSSLVLDHLCKGDVYDRKYVECTLPKMLLLSSITYSSNPDPNHVILIDNRFLVAFLNYWISLIEG